MSERAALEVFDQLLDLDAAARVTRLNEIAAQDPQLADTLRRWLEADARVDARVDGGLVQTLLAAPAGKPGIAPGDRIGVYRLTRELGRGGMGQVWLAERADGEFAQQVALKLIHPDLGSREAAPRFRRERQILADLRHPNIARLLDGGVTGDGRPWLAMEWVEGQSLREEVRRGPLPLRRVLTLGAQIAEALAHAHAAGIVHRDLKPENVLVTREGYAKVLDFGIAKLLHDERPDAAQLSATQPGLLLGTVAYMSPEQASGEPVDFRSDQFALGAMLYELARGRPAFARDTQAATLSAVLLAEPTALDGSDPLLPPALVQVLRRCLAKDPGERYAATLDLAHDLKAVQSGASVFSAAPAVRRRPPLGTLPAMSIGAVVAAVLAAAWVWWRPPAPATMSAVDSWARAEIAIAPAEKLWFGSFEMHAFALSPDGRRLAYVGIGDGPPRLYLRELDRRESLPLAGSEGASNPVFSPDGEWIAFFGSQKLKKIPVAGGGATVLAEAPNALGGLTWVGNERIVYSPHPGIGLFAVAATGGEPGVLTVPDVSAGEAGHLWPASVPGTPLLIYAAEVEAADSFDAARIYLFDPTTGRRNLLVDGGSDPRVVGNTLTYARANTIYAVDFDAVAGALSGSPKPLHEDVTYSAAIGAAQFASAGGVSVHLRGGRGEDHFEPVIVDRAGTVTSLGLAPAAYEQLRLSPDGRRVMLQITAADDDLWSFDLERRTLSRVTDFAENLHPAWMPDGESIIYSHHATPVPPPPTLYRRRADGSGEEEMLLAPSDGVRARLYSDVSPDARFVVYSQYTLENNFDLWLLDLESRDNREWLSTPQSDTQPRFSPDGLFIAYYSSTALTGGGQVYVQSIDGRARRWQISTEGGSASDWRRDGREIYYIRRGVVHAVALAAGDDLAPGAPKKLFEGDYSSRFDAFPDGERFLMLRRVPAASASGPLLLDLPLAPAGVD